MLKDGDIKEEKGKENQKRKKKYIKKQELIQNDREVFGRIRSWKDKTLEEAV